MRVYACMTPYDCVAVVLTVVRVTTHYLINFDSKHTLLSGSLSISELQPCVLKKDLRVFLARISKIQT